MDTKLRDRLKIPPERLKALNAILLDPEMRVIDGVLEVVAKYGDPEEINRKAAEAGSLPALMRRVERDHPENLRPLKWLTEQRDRGAFISLSDYRRRVLGERAATTRLRSPERPRGSSPLRASGGVQASHPGATWGPRAWAHVSRYSTRFISSSPRRTGR